MVVFKAYGLADVVDGSSSLEKLTKAEEKDVWLKKDAKAQKIIVTTIERKLMMHIINCERAKDMFDKIKNIFEKSSHEQVCERAKDMFDKIKNIFEKSSHEQVCNL
ncbi:hypothetical protein QE152_g30365 [Popillia japonica]|uniref:Uncharacterized protein n=1 Tax=Popillia japonica TaxID=7064 RepID=A0AAW1JEL8_POPJA